MDINFRNDRSLLTVFDELKFCVKALRSCDLNSERVVAVVRIEQTAKVLRLLFASQGVHYTEHALISAARDET
jgi:hypothetical protein